MNDNYSEDLVSAKIPMAVMAGMIISMLVTALSAGAAVLFGKMILFGGSVIGLIVFFVIMSYRETEYEYLFANKDVEISKIVARSSRKVVYSFSLDNVKLVAPTDSQRMLGIRGGESAMKRKDYSSKLGASTKYSFIVEEGGTKTEVILEPSEKSLAIVKPYMKHEFYQD